MHERITAMKSTIVSAVAGASLLLVAGSAIAETIPGFAGKPTLGADAACLTINGGAILNQCGRQVIYKIPLVVNPGFKTVNIRVNNPGGGAFSCQLITTPPVTSTATLFPNVGVQTVPFPVTVPSGNSLLVSCNVNPGGQILDVDYNQ